MSRFPEPKQVVLGIATHVVPEDELAGVAAALTRQLATGPTRSYAATRTLLKAWSSGGVAAADLVMLDVAMELFNGADAQRGFANTADGFRQGYRAASACVRREIRGPRVQRSFASIRKGPFSETKRFKCSYFKGPKSERTLGGEARGAES